MKGFLKFEITLTWSKIVALILIVLGFTLDVMYDKSGTVFMYVVPFAVFLITGKQVNDRMSLKKKADNEKV